MPRQHAPACFELHRQDHVFKTVCVSIGVVGRSYNREGCWLCRWVQLGSRCSKKLRDPRGKGQSHRSGIGQSLGWEHHPILRETSVRILWHWEAAVSHRWCWEGLEEWQKPLYGPSCFLDKSHFKSKSELQPGALLGHTLVSQTAGMGCDTDTPPQCGRGQSLLPSSSPSPHAGSQPLMPGGTKVGGWWKQSLPAPFPDTRSNEILAAPLGKSGVVCLRFSHRGWGSLFQDHC